jgi:hypothetical protein
MPLRSRLLWLALNVIVFGVVLALWRPPPADGYVGPYPNVLNRTWYGPALLLLIPTSMYWVSLAAQRRSFRIIGRVVSVTVFLIAVIVVLKARENTMYT